MKSFYMFPDLVVDDVSYQFAGNMKSLCNCISREATSPIRRIKLSYLLYLLLSKSRPAIALTSVFNVISVYRTISTSVLHVLSSCSPRKIVWFIIESTSDTMTDFHPNRPWRNKGGQNKVSDCTGVSFVATVNSYSPVSKFSSGGTCYSMFPLFKFTRYIGNMCRIYFTIITSKISKIFVDWFEHNDHKQEGSFIACLFKHSICLKANPEPLINRT